MTTNPMNFLKVSGIRIGEAARKRKIRSGDILLAIDGYAFNEDTKELKAKFESGNAPWLLTFLRGDVVFDVLFDEPLKSDFDLTDTEGSEKAKACLKKHTYGLWNEYKTFEVYRDLHKKARIIEILKDPFAGLLPPIWMLQNRLFFPLASILIIYGVTFIANIYLCLVSVVLVGIYTHRAQISLKRSYCLFDEKFLWFVSAGKSEMDILEKIMLLDPETKCRQKIDNETKPTKEKITKILPQPADYLT